MCVCVCVCVPILLQSGHRMVSIGWYCARPHYVSLCVKESEVGKMGETGIE